MEEIQRVTLLNRIRAFKEKYFASEGIELTDTICELIRQLGSERATEYLRKWSIEKRTKWYEENQEGLKLSELKRKVNLRKAYETVMLVYLKNDPSDVPIVKETNKKLIWITKGPCPVLEACKTLGLDTKNFCKKAYEEPARVLFKLINPRINFGRNYERIRPYSDGCEEFIMLEETI